MDESIQQQLDQQTLMLKEILERLSLIEQSLSIPQPTSSFQSNSSALAHLRALGEMF